MDKQTLKRILFVIALIGLVTFAFVIGNILSDAISNSDTQVYYEGQVIHNPYQYIETDDENINELPKGYHVTNKKFQIRIHAKTVL